MGDKSPHDSHHSLKSAKSIKEKRADKRSKQSAANTVVPPTQAPAASATSMIDSGHRNSSA